jgi:hypothetical protein
MSCYPPVVRTRTIVGVAALLLLGSGLFDVTAQQRRTEADARATAERNVAERARLETETGRPVGLIYDTPLARDYAAVHALPVPQDLDVDRSFYKKYVNANGIPVLASGKTPDLALWVARDIVNSMLEARPDLRASLVRRNWRTGVFAETEMTMDWPEYAHFRAPGRPRDLPVTQEDRDYHANRSRGMGGNPTTGAEENLLGYPGTRYFGEHIFVHEFAHAVHSAVRDVDPAMTAEISASYDAAKKAGKYLSQRGAEHYALTNAGEYWAEGVQWWFFSNYGECLATGGGRFVKVDSPEEFHAYDPTLFELISRVFKTHRVPADVFHGRQIRRVNCPVN